MPRHVPAVLLLFTAVALLGACTDSLTPTGKDARPGVRADIIGPDRPTVQSDLNALYPAGAGITTAANTQLTNIWRSLDGSQIKAAQQQAAAFCTFTQKQAAGGRLTSLATSDAVTNFCNELYLSTGLGPGGIDVSSVDATAQFIPACTAANVTLLSDLASVSWPAKDPSNTTCTFDQDVTLIITPIDYTKFSPGDGPIATKGMKQWPYFYEITVSPYLTPANDVTIGVCQIIDDTDPYYPPEATHPQLRLAHNVLVNGVPTAEVLRRTGTNLTCGATAMNETPGVLNAYRDRGLFAASGLAASKLGHGLLAALTPNKAYAAHLAAAGLAGSFSPFGAVDVGSPNLSTAYVLDPDTAYVGLPDVQMQILAASTTTPYIDPATLGCQNGTWLSSDPTIASVGYTGLLHPIAGGTTNVSVVCGSSRIGVTVTVISSPVIL